MSARISPEEAGGQNVVAFLDTIAFSEGTAFRGDDGYNVLVGGQLFQGYVYHPRELIHVRDDLYSTAAGRYQFLAHTWDDLASRLGLTDFSPVSQDKGAIELIRERDALDDIVAGRFVGAVAKCSTIWASFPGNNYGQRVQRISELAKTFTTAGGLLT